MRKLEKAGSTCHQTVMQSDPEGRRMSRTGLGKEGGWKHLRMLPAGQGRLGTAVRGPTSQTLATTGVHSPIPMAATNIDYQGFVA